MADKFYGLNKGQVGPDLVAESGSTTGRTVELRVNDAMYTDKLSVILAVRGLLNYLETRETSPIA
jgi:hypothetical protein